MKVNFKQCYLDQEVTIFHLECNVFDCISMLDQVFPDFWGERVENRNHLNHQNYTTTVIQALWWWDSPSFPGFSGDAKTKSICEERGTMQDQGQMKESIYLIQEGSVIINLILSDDMRNHLSTPSLQTLVGQRLKAHLITVVGGCLWSVNMVLFYSGKSGETGGIVAKYWPLNLDWMMSYCELNKNASWQFNKMMLSVII